MTQPPLSLEEFRQHLNLTEDDPTGDDAEMWACVVAATEQVEAQCGPVRPRTITRRVAPAGCSLALPVYPVVSVTTVTDAEAVEWDAATYDLNLAAGVIESAHGWAGSRWYDVELVVGRDPVPEALIEAVKILAKMLWETQRGPAQAGRFTGIGDMTAAGMSTGIDKYRAEQLLAPHRQLAFA